MSAMIELENNLKKLIIDACQIPDASEDFPSDSPLIGPDSALGLDSLDAVEVVVAVQREFGVRIGGEDTSREVLQSIKTLAEFVHQEQGA